ncbi:putative DNA helicase INO80 [Chenopodium quinoa]|uniref:putative DNA helicase INO80 n=1 Tax=Chenopodium quinoa TaxID=63459 RepID=UPI000B78D20E|nr:putative DNA helicase INO80 [Chenopodium quinoa]
MFYYKKKGHWKRDCLKFKEDKKNDTIASVPDMDTMARTKRTARYTNSYGSSYYVQMSELSDQPPGPPSTLSDSILGISEELKGATPMLIDMLGLEPVLSEKEESASSESSNKDMDKISASKKVVALLRAAIISQKRPSTDSPSKETSKGGALRPSPSEQPNPKVRKQMARSTPGSSRKQPSDKQAWTPQSGAKQTTIRRDTRPPRGLSSHTWSPPPISEKNKEVKAAKAMTASDCDRVMFQIAQNEILTTDILYYQAAATLQVKDKLEATKKNNLELEKAVKDLQDQLQPLKHVKHAADELKKLKEPLASQEETLSKQLSAKAETKKMALAQDMMEDASNIMRMTWTALFPDLGYKQWESKFVACTEEYNIKIMKQPADEDEEKDEAADTSSDGEDGNEEEEEEADVDKGETEKEEADANQNQAPANEPQENVLEEQAPIAKADQAAAINKTLFSNA